MTTTCPHCGGAIAQTAAPPAEATSRQGAAKQADEGAEDWISVGRFTNLAEVGYFSDLFVDKGIPCRTRQHDEFRATDGSWGVLFILQVPEPLADRAVDLLKAELAKDQSDTDLVDDGLDWPGTAPTTSAETVPSGLARSALLVVVVGGLAFLAGRAGPNAQRNSAPRPRPCGEP